MRLCFQILQCFEVSQSQIYNVDVIPYTSSVGRILIVAPNIQKFASTHSHLCHKRRKIIGYPPRIFSNQAGHMRANWIEVTQYANMDHIEQIAQNVFKNRLNFTIEICSRQIRSMARAQRCPDPPFRSRIAICVHKVQRTVGRSRHRAFRWQRR